MRCFSTNKVIYLDFSLISLIGIAKEQIQQIGG